VGLLDLFGDEVEVLALVVDEDLGLFHDLVDLDDGFLELL
jgi:hypothetical protein